MEQAACDVIFQDHGISAVASQRNGFEAALSELSSGDIFVIWKMDRAFRSLRHALDVLEELENRNVQFRSLTDQIDTTTPMGKCMYQIRNAFAELERNLISERTKAGMEAARKRGVLIGRPPKLTDDDLNAAQCKIAAGSTINSVAKELGVSGKTLSHHLKKRDN